MTTDTRSPQEIERAIERDRAQLTDNLETLQDRFSLDGVMRSVGDQLRDHGGDIGASISRTVKENPAAVALTGIGLAWMIFGNKSANSNRSVSGSRRSGAPEFTSHHDREPEYKAPRPSPRYRAGHSGMPSWALEDDHDDDSYADRVTDTAAAARDGVYDAASSASKTMSNAASSTRDGVTDAASSAKAAVSGAASSAASSAADMARSAEERAARLKERLAQGTETLSEEAKSRVIAARQAAVDARRRAAQAASAGAERASDLYDSQPLVAGALAVAIGAAIGGALPRTQKEDDLFGAQSDDLMQEAERIFKEEQEKAKAVIAAAKDEAKAVAKETRDDLNSGAPGDKTAVEAVVDEAKSAGNRVVEAAEKKADEKGLGKISS